MKLPILGIWGLSRRVIQVRRQAARDAALGIVRMTGEPSEKWFAIAERYRLEDNARHFAAIAQRGQLRDIE
jgi:hypothetical protein